MEASNRKREACSMINKTGMCNNGITNTNYFGYCCLQVCMPKWSGPFHCTTNDKKLQRQTTCAINAYSEMHVVTNVCITSVLYRILFSKNTCIIGRYASLISIFLLIDTQGISVAIQI